MPRYIGLKVGVIEFLFIFIILTSAFGNVGASKPYWIRQGVYFKYTAKGEHSVVLELPNGTIYTGEYGVFTWRIIEVSREYITVNASLEAYNLTMSYQRILSPKEGLKKAMELIKKYSRLNLTKSGSCSIGTSKNEMIRICEDEKAVVVSIRSKDYMYGIYVKKEKEAVENFLLLRKIPKMTKSITFNVSLKDNSVLYKGKRIGMNTLFLLDLNVKGKVVMEEWHIKDVRELNATVHARFREFKPPIILVTTNFYKNASNFALYDPATGILIEGYMIVSPVWKLFGFEKVAFSDKEHFKKTKEPVTKSKDIYGFGMVLEDTNAFYFKKDKLENVGIPIDSLLILILSLSVFLVVAYERIKARRMGK
ncbi:hypothetical protein [Pyrococcus horikoshii]|nr:hypothetical protein [Pyrococcus horikoshii]HII60481.1 hypothetical protein [Pyrococcus horikoshii]